jgi:hypothetical protein
VNLDIPIEQKQSVLDTEDLVRRMRMVLDVLTLKLKLARPPRA